MEVLNMDEACKYLRVAKPTLYKYIRTGQIPAFKMGRVWKFDRESLEVWVKNQVQSGTQARSMRE